MNSNEFLPTVSGANVNSVFIVILSIFMRVYVGQIPHTAIFINFIYVNRLLSIQLGESIVNVHVMLSIYMSKNGFTILL